MFGDEGEEAVRTILIDLQFQSGIREKSKAFVVASFFLVAVCIGEAAREDTDEEAVLDVGFRHFFSFAGDFCHIGVTMGGILEEPLLNEGEDGSLGDKALQKESAWGVPVEEEKGVQLVFAEFHEVAPMGESPEYHDSIVESSFISSCFGV